MNSNNRAKKESVHRFFVVLIVAILLITNFTVISFGKVQKAEMNSDKKDELDEEFEGNSEFSTSDFPEIKGEYGKNEMGSQYIVEMRGPVKPEWRRTIDASGAEVINYIPDHSYRILTDKGTASALEDLEFVENVKRYNPFSKICGDLSNNNVRIVLRDNDNLSRRFIEQNLDIFDAKGRFLSASVSSRNDLMNITDLNNILWIENYSRPKLHDETSSEIVGGYWSPGQPYDGPGNYANQLGYNGSDVVVSVCDTGIGTGETGDAGHIDFTGRVIGGKAYPDGEGWVDTYGHGTHCAGLIGGDTHNGRETTYGNTSYYVGQGVAPEVKLYSQKLFSDGYMTLPDFDRVFREAEQNGTYVHSNSWGASTMGMYYSYDEIYDAKVRDSNGQKAGDQWMITTVSAGNSGSGNQTTGSPGNAKNVITVGATENYHPDADMYGNDLIGHDEANDPSEVTYFSSRGPTEDGRIKPDVVAPGYGVLSTKSPEAERELYGTYSEDSHYAWCSGTSMSNPLTAGAASVVVDWYNSTLGERPSPAMVKALLVNTASDLDNDEPIPNYDEGWGQVHLPGIVNPDVDWFLRDSEDELQTGERSLYNIECLDENRPMNISLTWTDVPSSPTNDIHLINDLDLKVYGPDGDVYYGNSFDNGTSVPFKESRWDRDGDGSDDRNNVVNVFIPEDEVKKGMYTVVVDGKNVPMDGVPETDKIGQDYALAVSNAERFESETPDLNILSLEHEEIMTTNETETISWTIGGGKGDVEVDLEYSVDDGETWKDLTSGSKGVNYYNWTVPYADSKVCRLRYNLTDEEDNTFEDKTRRFRITPVYVDLQTPAGGESFIGSCWEKIRWDSKGVPDQKFVDIWFSRDNGVSWEKIASNMTDDSEFKWRPPNSNFKRCFMKATISNDMGDNFTSISEDPFEILYRHDSPILDEVENKTLPWDEYSRDKNDDYVGWHPSIMDSNSGNYSWYSGRVPYEPSTSSLTSPPIRLTAHHDRVRFSFYHKFSFGYTPYGYGDGGVVQVWDNETRRWQKIDPIDDYPGSMQEDGTFNPLGGESAFVGEQDEWTKSRFNLTGYAGKTVRMRFKMGSDYFFIGDSEGWQIDDIYFGSPPEYEVQVNCQDKEKRVLSEEKTDFDISIRNSGIRNDTYDLGAEASLPVKFYDRDGNEIKSISISPGDKRKVTARVSIPGNMTEGKNVKLEVKFSSTGSDVIAESLHLELSKVITGDYFSDFEKRSPGWRNYSRNVMDRPDFWNTTEGRSCSENRSWWSGNETMNAYLGQQTVLESPYFKLRDDLSSARLSFQHWYSFSANEWGYLDGGFVEIWDEESRNWTRITPKDGYDGEISADYYNPIAGDDAYSGFSNEWEKERFDLSSYTGEVVKIRFRAGWDYNIFNCEGWFIDDFYVGETPDNDAETELLSDNKMGEPGESVEYEVRIENHGKQPSTFELKSVGSWPSYFMDDGETISNIRVDPESSESISLRVDIPGDAGYGICSGNTISIRSLNKTDEAFDYNITTETPYLKRIFEGAEKGEGLWDHHDLGDGLAMDSWQLSGNKSEDGNMSWWSGGDPITWKDGGESVLESPYIKLEGDSDRAWIEFDHWYSFGMNPGGYADGSIVEIWDSSSQGWTKINPEKDYDEELSEGYLNPLGGEEAFAGSSKGWIHSTFDVSEYVGKTIQVRFHVGWDYGGYEDREGWYVDNIDIGLPRDHEFDLKNMQSKNFGEPGEWVEHRLKINNTGIRSDTYRFEISSNWSSRVVYSGSEIDELSIERNESKEVKVEVRIPGSAEVDANETTVINIRSVNESSRISSVSFETVVRRPVLLVIDDYETNLDMYYKRSLQENDLGFNTWNIYERGVPYIGSIKDHEAMIWFTGDPDIEFSTALSREERDLIQRYLKDYGSIYLSSPLAAYDSDINGWQEWHERYLKSTFYSMYYNKEMITSQKHSPITDDFNFDIYYEGDLTRSYSVLQPIDDNYTEFTTLEYEGEFTFGSRATFGKNRLVYSSFEFASVGDEDQDELMDRIVRWLLGYPNVPFERTPDDNSEGISFDPELKMYVSDPDSDRLNVTFYDAADDSVIGRLKDVDNGTNVKITWEDRLPKTTYFWYAVIDDGSNERITKTWSFSTKTDWTAPVAKADIKEEVSLGEKVILDASNSSDDSRIKNYTWIINPGQDQVVLDGEITSYTFSELGEYRIKLIVEDFAGHKSFVKRNVEVLDTEPPEAKGGPDRTICIGREVNLTAENSTDDVRIENYTWAVEDSYYYDKNITHTFDELGVYDVTLSVRDAGDNLDNHTFTITVKDLISPEAVLEENRTVKEDSEIFFNGYNSTDNIAIENFTWDFGDGTEGYGINTSHIFEEPGTYNVTLTVKDGEGNVDKSRMTVEVQEREERSSDVDIINILIPVIVLIISIMIIVKLNRKYG